MRVCDWIADYIYSQGIKRVHGLMGGGAMGLNDGFIKHGKLEYICYHHEQGAGHAAIGESKFTGNPAVLNPTTGCGGTNCITSILDAWQDGVPLIVLSGNVKTNDCTNILNNINFLELRKHGIQEHNIIETVKSITKFTRFLECGYDIYHDLPKAFHLAKNGRPGPVWIDIPSDIQTLDLSKSFKPKLFVDFVPSEEKFKPNAFKFFELYDNFFRKERRLILIGNGIRQSNTVEQFRLFIEKFKIPFVTTYGASDILPFDHPLNIGTVGVKGSRSGNFALANCESLLVLGSSLSTGVYGYDARLFAPKSFKCCIDIDLDEIEKNRLLLSFNLNIYCSLTHFFKFTLENFNEKA